jgi:hypothetical protein
MKKYEMKKFECECGCVIGLNQVKRHQQGKEHLKRMEKLNKKKEEKILLEEMVSSYCPHSVDGLIHINNCYECESCENLLCKDCDDYTYINDKVYCNKCKKKKMYDDDLDNFIFYNCSHSVGGVIHIDNVDKCDCCGINGCISCNVFTYLKDYDMSCCYYCVDKIKKNDKINDKWTEIVERRSHYLKQEEQDKERDLRIIQLTNISDKYLEWLID